MMVRWCEANMPVLWLLARMSPGNRHHNPAVKYACRQFGTLRRRVQHNQNCRLKVGRQQVAKLKKCLKTATRSAGYHDG
jgi:hypothetical protein